MQQHNNKYRTFKTLNYHKAIHIPLLQFIIPLFLFAHISVKAQVNDKQLPIIIDWDLLNWTLGYWPHTVL